MSRLVEEREKLASLSPGGRPDRPIEVDSAAVVEVRVRALRCPQCEGEYRLEDHEAPGGGIRKVSVICRLCQVRRPLWFRLGSLAPN